MGFPVSSGDSSDSTFLKLGLQGVVPHLRFLHEFRGLDSCPHARHKSHTRRDIPRFEPPSPDSALCLPLSTCASPTSPYRANGELPLAPQSRPHRVSKAPFLSLLYFCLQSHCKLVVGALNRPLWRMLWKIPLSTGNGSLLLVHDLAVKVRDAQQVVS